MIIYSNRWMRCLVNLSTLLPIRKTRIFKCLQQNEVRNSILIRIFLNIWMLFNTHVHSMNMCLRTQSRTNSKNFFSFQWFMWHKVTIHHVRLNNYKKQVSHTSSSKRSVLLLFLKNKTFSCWLSVWSFSQVNFLLVSKFNIVFTLQPRSW